MVTATSKELAPIDKKNVSAIKYFFIFLSQEIIYIVLRLYIVKRCMCGPEDKITYKNYNYIYLY